MKLTSLRTINYKGFDDSGDVELDPNWNVVVGQNNAGKTSFMEGFRLKGVPQKPHRSLSRGPTEVGPQQSQVTARIVVERHVVKDVWLSQNTPFYLPIGFRTANGWMPIIDPQTFWAGEPLSVDLTFSSSGSVTSNWPSHGLFAPQTAGMFSVLSTDGNFQPGDISSVQDGHPDNLPDFLAIASRQRIYLFEAQRSSIGQCDPADTEILAPNASNLAAVLMRLQGNVARWARFKAHVHAIFPSVRDVVVLQKHSQFQIRLWTVDPATERDDLTVALADSGTGVGQVLAILYVAMTMPAGTIAIDEPNSFLHPGAAKKLIQILKTYQQHQYVISTHSPEIVTVAQPARLHLVQTVNGQSLVSSYGKTEIATKQMLLEEVGASLGDVFSAEQVIWVEGPTERECFNLIASEALNLPMIGMAFVAMRNVGDLEAKTPQAAATLEIYEALSQGGSILPITVAFSFDRECRTTDQVADLERRLKGLAKVLPRRMTENYLLHGEAIVATLSGLGERGLTVAKINALVEEFGPTRMPKGGGQWGTHEAIESVDAARLLADVFHEASEGRCEYRKVRDSVELLRWILNNEPAHVGGLVGYVNRLINDDRS